MKYLMLILTGLLGFSFSAIAVGVNDGALYKAVVAATEGIDCGNSQNCLTSISNLQCQWPNTMPGSRYQCTFLNGDGKAQKVWGGKAKAIIEALKGQYGIDQKCVTGVCKYTAPIEALACEQDAAESGARTISHRCTIKNAALGEAHAKPTTPALQQEVSGEGTR